MSKNLKIIVPLALIIISIGLLLYGFLIMSIFLQIFSLFLIVVNTIFLILIKSFEVFLMDKNLNEDDIIRAGLNITQCSKCQKTNVLEDKYCIYCGEELIK
jgi:hypothetical protein